MVDGTSADGTSADGTSADGTSADGTSADGTSAGGGPSGGGRVDGSTWRDHRDRSVVVPRPPSGDDQPFYVDIGAWQGPLYDRNAFTAGTAGEVEALVARTGLAPGQRVLDVGCGSGRHGVELARRGIDGVGVDISGDLLAVARTSLARARDPHTDATTSRADARTPDSERLPTHEPADGPSPADAKAPGLDAEPLGTRSAGGGVASGSWSFVRGDARSLTPVLTRFDLDGSFDVAWSLCHGGFGTDPAGDAEVLEGLATAVRPGGLAVVTAFHALFAVRHLVEGDAFDPEGLVHHQRSEVRGPDDGRRTFDLWTISYTVRDLRRMAADVGLEVVSIDGAEPGAYDRVGVGLDDPELLAVLRRPA